MSEYTPSGPIHLSVDDINTYTLHIGEYKVAATPEGVLRFLAQVRREARTVTQEQIATMSRAVAVHAAGNLPGLPDDEFECCFRAALHEAGFIVEQEGKNDE